jgi:thiol-disulfide isomerase/thioredoxin
MFRPIFALAAIAATVAFTLSCGAAPGPPAPAPPTGAQAQPAAPVAQANVGTAIRYTGLDGATFTVADLPGDVKVINYWATWCAPCIREIPSFNQIHAKYGSKGVTVVGVSVDEEGAEIVQPFLKTAKGRMDYRVALAKLDDLGPIGVTTSIPVTLVYDKSGKLMKRFDGFAEEKELEETVVVALAGAAS